MRNSSPYAADSLALEAGRQIKDDLTLEPFKIHILGCGSALPTLRHNPSSQVVEVREKLFMVDCGEGTQLQLRRCRVKFNRLQAVFISHIHGDHCFGLPGLISTLGMLGRTAPLSIYGPKELGPVVDKAVNIFCHDLGYEVTYHDVDTSAHQVIFEDRSITVESVPLSHRVPCCGFLFREKRSKPHVNRDMTDYYEVPVDYLPLIRQGFDWTTAAGEKIPNAKLTTPPDSPRSYAYCSDTRYLPDLHKMVEGVNVLYHESTYASDHQDFADTYFHSTAAQAASVARDAHVGQLLLGHYSARYEDETRILLEAREVFPNSMLTEEGMIVDVK